MSKFQRLRLCGVFAAVAAASACGDVTPSRSVAAAGAEPIIGEELMADVPGAPLQLNYSILGSPVTGQGAGVELSIETPLDDRVITLTYRAAEAGSLTFPEAQATEIEVVPVSGSELRPVQLTVIPQREGRIFLNVTASVETDTGAVRKALAVPLQVRPAPLSEDDGQVP